MRYLFSVIAHRDHAVLADTREMAAIDAFNDKIEAAGQRILAVGLADPASAVVFDHRTHVAEMTRGPAVDAKSFMAGLWIIEASSDEVAYQLAGEASRACNRRIEVRPVL